MVQGEAEPPVVVEARSICLLPLGLRHRSWTTLTEAGMPCSGISPSCRVRRELLRLTRLSSILGGVWYTLLRVGFRQEVRIGDVYSRFGEVKVGQRCQSVLPDLGMY